jgi:nicotinamidase-related amidase
MTSHQNLVLLIIDAQKGIDNSDYWGGGRNNPNAEENIKLLLDAWRQKKQPVIFIQHASTTSVSPLRKGTSGHEFKDGIVPGDNELVIEKSTPCAFTGTHLESYLKQMKAEAVVITGFITNNSVESTARTSGNLGFKTFVVSDATATFRKKGMHGEFYDAELVHNLSLANLHKEYADIVTTEQVHLNLLAG